MDQFIRKVGEALDRRSFLRGLGKLGMVAATVTGGLFVAGAAEAATGQCACSDKSGKGPNQNPCHGLNSGDTCFSNGKKGGSSGTCIPQTNYQICDCKCVTGGV